MSGDQAGALLVCAFMGVFVALFALTPVSEPSRTYVFWRAVAMVVSVLLIAPGVVTLWLKAVLG